MDLLALLEKMSLTEKCYQLQQVNSNIFMADENMPITGPEFYLQFDKRYKYEVASVYNSYGAERNIARAVIDRTNYFLDSDSINVERAEIIVCAKA